MTDEADEDKVRNHDFNFFLTFETNISVFIR